MSGAMCFKAYHSSVGLKSAGRVKRFRGRMDTDKAFAILDGLEESGLELVDVLELDQLAVGHEVRTIGIER